MKARNTYISLSLALLVAAVCADASHAQNARFNYAKNLWKMEEARVPGSRYAPKDNSVVKAGSVPANMHGLDKDFLSKPEPRPAVSMKPLMAATPSAVTAQPTSKQVTPQMVSSAPMQPALKAVPYQEKFGKPQASPPQVAHFAAPAKLPALASSPMPGDFTPEAEKEVSAQLSHRRAASARTKSVSARMSAPARPAEQVARAQSLPPVASYGGTKHYSAGSFVDTMQKKSVGTVHGEIISR